MEQQLDMNLEVVIKGDVRRYIEKNMPTFLEDISNWICQDIHRNLEDPETLFNIGNEYFLGTQCDGKSKKASKKSRFRVNGQIKRLQLLGKLKYEIELVVEQDYTRAMIFYLAAADRGHAAAHYMLGLMHFKGLGVEPNSTEALKWFRRSHNQKELFPEFMVKKLDEEGPILFLTDDLNRGKKKWLGREKSEIS
jgi:TPR repeat protein